jgi:hypothetical protein
MMAAAAAASSTEQFTAGKGNTGAAASIPAVGTKADLLPLISRARHCSVSKRTKPLRGTWRYDNHKRTSPTNASSGQEAENKECSSKIPGRRNWFGGEAGQDHQPGLIPERN